MTLVTQLYRPSATVNNNFRVDDMAPESIPLKLDSYPKLDHRQTGHLRHFYNLAYQPDGEWHLMGSQEPAQEFLDAYRYQLATMTYGAGVTHYHRLPALRSIFKPLIRQLIHKMLHRGCWGYWFNTSHSGKLGDPSLEKLREPWADPVVRENIMYSGHLLLMTSLYAMLFDDDEFEKPDSIVFDWNPMFWGFAQKFTYDNRSLQRAIIAEMERNNWVGVCCEPNLVFVVCNQFPMIGMRYNDARDGTHVVDDVLQKYKAAWDEKGLVLSDGLFPDWWMVKQERILPARDVSFTAWACAFMNTWNHDLVESLYSKQSLGFITNINGQIRLQPKPVANAYREAVMSSSVKTSSGGTATDVEVLSKVIEEAKASIQNPNSPKPPFPYIKPTLGYVVKWLSELGKAEELNGLLEYADKDLNPKWENGGLYYPRNDKPFNEELEWTHMDPFTGNSAIGYSRLNVKHGQKKMWEEPWTREILQSRPWVDGLDIKTVAPLRGIWDENAGALIVTVKAWDHDKALPQTSIVAVAKNMPAGKYAIYVRGRLQKEVIIEANGSTSISEEIKRGEEVDIVYLRS